MPRFPRCSGSECARMRGPSRRQIMIGTAATAAIAPLSFDSDPAVRACDAWLSCRKEYEDLTRRWQTLETYLFRHHNWCRLSRRQRATIPEAAELDAIDDRRDQLSEQEQQLLTVLLQANATTSRGLAAKLKVATFVVRYDENAEAHQLITGVLCDYQRMIEAIVK